MRLDAYDRVHKTLHFTQKKTGVPVMLPVVEVAASALNAYIDQARPVTSACNLFVTVQAPYTAVRDMNSILKPIMARAGIRKENGKGFHAFRRALGGMLLNNGVKIGLISQILGHTNMASVDRYLPYAVTSLKSCIMDMPPLERKKEVSS